MPSSIKDRIDDLNARVTGLEVAVQDTYPAKFRVLAARITRLEQAMEKMQPVSIQKIEKWLGEIDRAVSKLDNYYERRHRYEEARRNGRD